MVLYKLYIDFKQVYDSTNREELYKALEKLKLMFGQNDPTEHRERSRTQGNISNAFKVVRALRQGNPLSALLFNLVLENIYTG